MTVYNWTAYSAGTDLGATTGFTRQTGNSGSIAVNSSKNLDFVTSSPISLYTCDEDSADCSFENTLIGGSGSGGNFYPCCVRVNDINNLIGLRITSANNLELVKYAAGAPTTLGTIAITGRATGDKIKLSAVGNTLNAYYNGVLKIGPITETFNNTQTKMGMFGRSSTINNFISAAESINLGVAISSINGGNGVRSGSTGNTITYTGSFAMSTFALAGISATNISGSGSSWTFDFPAQVDDTLSQNWGAKTATAGNGSTSLTLATSYLPPAGYSHVTLADPIDQSINGDVYQFSPAAVATDQIATLDPETPTSTSATSTTTITGTQTAYHWSSVTGKFYTFELITGDLSLKGKLTYSNLTSSNLTSRAVTQ